VISSCWVRSILWGRVRGPLRYIVPESSCREGLEIRKQRWYSIPALRIERRTTQILPIGTSGPRSIRNWYRGSLLKVVSTELRYHVKVTWIQALCTVAVHLFPVALNSWNIINDKFYCLRYMAVKVFLKN
jgi:hypothetical protein